MNEFNLEQALAGAKVVTRVGRKATQFHLFDITDDCDYPLLCIVSNRIVTYDLKGKCHSDIDTHYDLFMASDNNKVKDKKANTFSYKTLSKDCFSVLAKDFANEYMFKSGYSNAYVFYDTCMYEWSYGLNYDRQDMNVYMTVENANIFTKWLNSNKPKGFKQ